MPEELTDRELLKKIARHFDERLDEIERKLQSIESDVSSIDDTVEQLQVHVLYLAEAIPHQQGEIDD